MRCDTCDQGERLPVRRAKLTERNGRVAVVLGVATEECPACGERWLGFDIARRLDELITAMLFSDAEVVTRHFDSHSATAAQHRRIAPGEPPARTCDLARPTLRVCRCSVAWFGAGRVPS